MEREQFTFYASFARAISRIKKKADRCEAYDAICRYALYGEEPDMDRLPDAAAIAFDLIRPVLDTAARKSKGGKTSPASEPDGGKRAARPEEDNGKTLGRCGQESGKEKEKEVEIEVEIEVEKEVEIEEEYESNSAREADGDVGGVMRFYLDRINANPSPVPLEKLKAYCLQLSPPVVMRALEVAVDERKYGWSYIEAILQRYSREGLSTLDAVQQSEAERAAAKSKGQDFDRRKPSQIMGSGESIVLAPEEFDARLSAAGLL